MRGQSCGYASDSDPHWLQENKWYSAADHCPNWHLRSSLSRWNGMLSVAKNVFSFHEKNVINLRRSLIFSQYLEVCSFFAVNSSSNLVTQHEPEHLDSMYNQVLALAMAYQSVTNHHLQRPPVDNLGPGDDLFL